VLVKMVEDLLRKGPGGGNGGGNGGGGGHTETAGNNLSFPVIWAENGSGLSVPGTAGEFEFTTPYDVDGDEVITTADQIGEYYQFAQKTAGNIWQAGIAEAFGPVYVTEVDWGDSLESVDMKVGRPVRVELSLYKDLGTTYAEEAALPDEMLSFPMELLANPSSPDEEKGAGATEYPISGPLPDSRVNTEMSTEATVYSAGAQLIIQPLVGTSEDVAEGDLKWDGSQWVDANLDDPTDIADPLTGITFAGELNVSGKVIYGLSQGGWRPTEVGDYRITFYMQPSVNTKLDYATIRQPLEEEVAAIAAEEGSDTGGGTAVVLSGLDPISDIDRNLTYIDISVVRGGGGGGGGGRPRGVSDLISLGTSEADSFSGDPLQTQFQELDRLRDPTLHDTLSIVETESIF
jgi:hypothetical protein